MSSRKIRFSRNSVALLALTAAIAVSLSIISFQYSSFTSSEILKIAAEDIRSNAKIEAHDLESVFTGKIEAVSSNLQVISSAGSVQTNQTENARTLFNAGQDSTGNLTDFYMWLDSEGKIVWISNINQTTYEQFKGTDLSHRTYFTEAKSRLGNFYSSAIDSNDNITRVYISRPIINSDTGEFAGVSVASISLPTFGKFLGEQLAPGGQSSVGMVDRKGIILYSQSGEFMGKGIFGPELQAVLPADFKDAFNQFMRRSLQGEAGIQDFSAGNTTATIAYEPIILEGEQFGTLYITTPQRFASNVGALVDQQRNFSTVMAIVIGTAAVGVAALVISWNTRLRQTVAARTDELKRSHDSLATANEQLKVHDRLQKEFINVAAHELRTPTQAILGYAELLQMDPADKDEMIKAIYRNSVRLQRLTSDILDVTRIESEALRIDKEKFNIKDVIGGAMQDAKNQLADGKVKFIYEPRDIFVKADRGRITQVIANLLDNAAKFTKEGTITINTEKRDGQAVISVRDTGSGIDPEIMPRLFSKFATKSDKGTGLGLFISRSIIEGHDGRIWCANNPDGRGATFGFSLPALEP